MLFNSYSFILLFLPLTLTVFYALLIKRGLTPALLWLLIASLSFYAWWNIDNLPVLISSILVNYFTAAAMVRNEGARRKRWFVIGIVFNLLLLGWFKYIGFITTNLREAGLDVPLTQVALPLAISFFTFQQISFLRGVYAAKDKMPGFLRYATFIGFFPHLIAGPILHHKEIQPQFGHLKREIPWDHITIGLVLFALGMFKKIMLADPLGELANPIYMAAAHGGSPGQYELPTMIQLVIQVPVANAPINFLQGWAAAFLYGFQLYFDFSGYSDMAIGLAHLFGIKFPKNFDSPLKSTSFMEFWQRWHITLTQFLREFLYLPLGGTRRSLPRTAFNILVTMGLGGLWHGASWNFLLWGLLHGFFIILNAAWRRVGIRLPVVIGWLFTIPVAMASMVLFRADDLTAAGRIYAAMFSLPDFHFFAEGKRYEYILLSLAVVLLLPNAVAWARENGGVPASVFGKRIHQWSRFRPDHLRLLFVLFVFLIAFLHITRLSIFLYFNF